jgi:S-DNA-T family DNA segregation ATPase FtsK/SpoIIIE
LVWFSVFFGFVLMEHYKDSFYLLRRHAWLQREYLADLSGWRTRCLDDSLVTAICFLIYLSARTIIWLRKILFFGLYQTQRERIGGGVERGGRG